ncbi:MAG: tRNA uridine-5-carboxymethylaminomethyl(34) synthesis GTPase MnmE [Deltaproteobacteria bacterium]|nr:tRNA uridine-5-carboxymethylaminomethyl(34) synthesis GTPase MnmE [Deltaproteobacteria bacterium]
MSDTIVACATAPGRGAIAIVRLSGPQCVAIAERMFQPRSQCGLEPWRLTRGNVIDSRSGQCLDDALAVYCPAPRTYTGEDVLEFHCHGAPVVVEQVVAGAVACGARVAEPGEFSRRAVLNGKMDLLQAEAIADLVNARVAAGARAAWDQLQGALSRRLQSIRHDLLRVLADVEASLDFSDDELPEEDCQRRVDAIAAVQKEIRNLLSGFSASRRVRNGIRVVFTGLPNAGKSSLINRLLGFGRMIVSKEPGTTRDVVEECVDLGGMAFVLADTAGLRESDSSAETEAVSRARATLREADVTVCVVDSSVPYDAADAEGGGMPREETGARRVVVFNKSDLACVLTRAARESLSRRADRVLRASAATGEGCDALGEALREIGSDITGPEAAGISRIRHQEALGRTLESLAAARTLAADETVPELVALELRQALRELESLTQPFDNEEVLDRIFAEFCIGK